MAIQESRYVSVFKINGFPILPPLMTTEKRREMLMYKERAVQLQQRKQKPTLELSPCNLLRHGHSHIPQPQTPRKQFVESGTSTVAVSKRDRMEKLRQTDTLVYDNRANSIILTLEGFEEETDFQSMEIERPQHLDQNDNKISPDVPKSPAAKSDNETKDEPNPTPSRPAPYAAFIPIPSICVNPPTPCMPNNPIVGNSPPRRLCSSPTLKPDSDSVLIRSNSFTLDGPSSALLEHIKNQKLKKSTATQDTVESKAKRVQKVENKPKARPPKSPSSTSLSHFPSNTSLFKAKRSPYELKPSAKAKLAKFHKFGKPNGPKKQMQAIQGNGDSVGKNSSIPPKSTTKLDLLKDIEEEHRARFLELVRQQQVEQKRLQDQFETQQKMLLEQLNARMAKVQMQSPPSSTVDSAQSSPSPEQDTKQQSSHITPRRRLFPELTLTEPAGTGGRDSSPSPQSISARRLEAMKLRRYWAATRINAFARGFLTRRLFRTDYVQRIVQTIKDTLIFVLNLHFEEHDDSSEASIKLKARLLQQLTSASRTLHAVFIETTVKERMEIIARDRKYIQAKQLNKRSPRILR